MNRGTIIRKTNDVENAKVIGGLREAYRAVADNSAALEFGCQLKSNMCDLIGEHKDWIPRVLDLLGEDDSTVADVQDAVDSVRNLIASETNCKNVNPVRNLRCSSAIRA